MPFLKTRRSTRTICAKGDQERGKLIKSQRDHRLQTTKSRHVRQEAAGKRLWRDKKTCFHAVRLTILGQCQPYLQYSSYSMRPNTPGSKMAIWCQLPPVLHSHLLHLEKQPSPNLSPDLAMIVASIHTHCACHMPLI